MKIKFLFLLVAFFFLLLSSQCSNHEPKNPSDINNPKHELPIGKKAMKVLAIGNSFVDDPMACFDTLVRASGIDTSNLCVYSAVRTAASLEYWAGVCENGDSVTLTRCAGQTTMPLTSAPLKQLLAQNWDVITVQQVSTQAQNPASLSPYLIYLVDQIRTLCPNKNMVIAWQQVWSYWRENDNLLTSTENWQRINEVAQLTLDYDIDMIIPTGTAIQNARSSWLNTPHGLTRDGGHLGYGVGQYVAACTWFEALIAPVFGVSVVGNTAVHAITETEKSHSTYETTPVTNENRLRCQHCAAAAVATPNQVTIL